MTTFRVRSADERREELQSEAAAKGIDEAYISLLVDSFYDRVRAHPDLGPIFERVIGNNWPFHLKRMKDFWASVALNAGRYSGKPVPAHQKLEGVTPEHFQTWLALFRSTLKETAPTPAAAVHFMERAERIAESLQFAKFGVPGLPLPGEEASGDTVAAGTVLVRKAKP